MQIKQAKNGARKIKSQQERRKYKSSQGKKQHKFHKLVCKRAELKDAPIGKGLFIY